MQKGPLLVLHDWLKSGQPVQVVTRHACGVRGKAVGTLRAFDRFMNLILVDVQEWYTVIVKVKRDKPNMGSACTSQGSTAQQQGHDVCSDQIHSLNAEQRHEQSIMHQRKDKTAINHVPPDDCTPDGSVGPTTADALDCQQQLEAPVYGLMPQQRKPGNKVRWCRKQEKRFRKLAQVMVKGDSIVLISCPAPTSAPTDAG